ncbi:MAG: site-specific DNA-methyltransferase, partial [Blastocatellia bacterium]
MAKIEITKTELVWPGKYDDDGALKETPRVSLPFQVIETVNESRATRESVKTKGPTLFDLYEGKEGDTFEEGWKNKLIWGDNLLVMGSLLEKFAGKIDLIYIDPPFATGADFSFTAEIGEGDIEVQREQSLIEEKVYRDTWGQGLGSYLGMMFTRLQLARELLSDRGSLYVHLDWHVGHYAKVMLDEIFGPGMFRNEIIREKCNPKNYTSGQFGNVHDVILFYSKSTEPTWNRIFAPRTDEQVVMDFPNIERKTGRRYKTAPLHAPGTRSGSTGKPWRGIALSPNYHWRYVPETLDELDRTGQIEWSTTGNPRKKVYADDSEGYAIQDIWLGMKDPGQQWYATEKPHALLRRIIEASSPPNGLVADFFCGSGTTLAVAEKLGCRWIGCDLGRWGIHVTRKRLLGIENCKPFEILNLGKYERQYWQGVTFAENGKTVTEQALYEYLAFILKLYGAQPVAGLSHLHGKMGKAMVHIGAVDAPVTIAEIDAAVDECAKLKQGELHVLGWEWEMGLYDLMVEAAKKKGVKLLLLQIPREVMEQQAAAKGDVRFFELAYLEAKIEKLKKLTAQVSLKDFVIPNTELIPEDVRSKVKKWSDYIDYWAVDWDFRNDTFMHGWVAY